MARQARSVQKTSLFSVSQESDCDIFRNREDRDAFVAILEKAKLKFGFDIYAYCLLDCDRFWIIMDAKKRNIASIMQSICISYSLYRNHEDNLFKARYFSKPLYDKEGLQEEIESLKSDKRYRNCAYCFYHSLKQEPLPFISVVNEKIVVESQHAQGLEDEEVKYLIDSMLKTSSFDSKDLSQRNAVIKILYAQHNLTQKQLAQYFGLSVSSVSKIIAG